MLNCRSSSASSTRHKVNNTTQNVSTAGSTSTGGDSSAAFKNITPHFDNITESGHATKSEVRFDYSNNNSALNNYSGIQAVDVSRLKGRY